MVFKRQRNFRNGRRAGFKRRKFGFGRQRNGYRGRSMGYNRSARVACAGVRKLRRYIETKTVNPGSAGWPSTITMTDSPAQVADMVGIGQGTGGGTRDGNEIYVTSIQFWFILYVTSANPHAVVTLLLFKDTQWHTGDGIPGLDDFYVTGGGDMITPSERILAERRRIKVLKKWTFNMVYNTTSMQKYFSTKVKFRRALKVCYDGSGSSISSLRSGPIFFGFYCDHSVGTAPEFAWTSRVNFTG